MDFPNWLNWRRFTVLLVVLGLAGLVGAGVGQAQVKHSLNALTSTLSSQGGGQQKVTICHRTASHSNPYVQITVAAAAVDGNIGNDRGKGDHLAEHTGPVFPATGPDGKWGDIIPPFDTNGNTYDGPPQTSLNWNSSGQAIWKNGCNLPGTTTPGTTTTPPPPTTVTVTVPTTVTTTVPSPPVTVTTPPVTVTQPGATVTLPAQTVTNTVTVTKTKVKTKIKKVCPRPKHHKKHKKVHPRRTFGYHPGTNP